jgi:hypothetical protein
MVPSGCLGYLNMPILSRIEEEQLDAIERDAIKADVSGTSSAAIELHSGAAGTNMMRLRSRISIAMQMSGATGHATKPENFSIFFHVLTQNHALPDFIWNQQTRRELQIGLENELQLIN